jgi:hypothetical protein
MTIHFRTSLVKMSKRRFDWGHRTHCGKKFKRGSDSTTTTIKWVNCQPCLKKLIAKREKELDYLKWALNDQKKLGEVRLPKKKERKQCDDQRGNPALLEKFCS